ncbi:MAG: bifunctional DNA-formamidopyrimidine glycosylase/DNA-(apurinic or apyrimidinic site) lyase [Gammaproteobacteria bacterium]|nr:bifunctional DNA-formamidopyrimidine glycosylase/DNA-(apurinic or apyrimidinic site) lyase [Gammaproteobacteria bacterium]
MPELPEVETTRRAIAPLVEGQRITGVEVREPRLRWPVPPTLDQTLAGQTIQSVRRRGKYLLLETGGEGSKERGSLILHLGMSGALFYLPVETPLRKHDHLDLVLANGDCLRLNDPRRFGAALWSLDPATHPLLSHLGPEPLELSSDVLGTHLHHHARGRTAAIKPFLMDHKMVVGVGNIYASEALHLAGIHPKRAAGRVSLARYILLAAAARRVLQQAIAAGGTTLRDFRSSDGRPGYFQQVLQVYGRTDRPCNRCDGTIRQAVLGQRASYWCPGCQH